MDIINSMLPIIIPTILIQLILMTIALWQILKHNNYKYSKTIWCFIVIFLQIIGPIVYFLIGRND